MKSTLLKEYENQFQYISILQEEAVKVILDYVNKMDITFVFPENIDDFKNEHFFDGKKYYNFGFKNQGTESKVLF